MDPASRLLTQLSSQHQRLSDEELLYAKSYLRGAESVATIRCKVTGAVGGLLCAYYTASAMLGIAGNTFASIDPLLTLLKNGGLAASALILLLSLMADVSLRRELHAASLPEEVKHDLRHAASGMDGYVIRRFFSGLLGRLRR